MLYNISNITINTNHILLFLCRLNRDYKRVGNDFYDWDYSAAILALVFLMQSHVHSTMKFSENETVNGILGIAPNKIFWKQFIIHYSTFQSIGIMLLAFLLLNFAVKVSHTLGNIYA